MITDGLVEERDLDIEVSLQGFRDLVLTSTADPEGLCDRLLALYGEDKEDDIAIITVALS